MEVSSSQQVWVIQDWVLHTPNGTQTPLRVPATFHDQLPEGTTTYRLSSELTPPSRWRDDTLCLGLPAFQGRSQLYVDGVPATSLNPSQPSSYRHSGGEIFCFEWSNRIGPRLHLELQVEHRWTQSAWMLVAPRLSRGDRGDPLTRWTSRFNHATSLIAIGFCLSISLSYVFLFAARRDRWFPLAYAVQCTGAAAYLLVLSGYGQWIGPTEAAVMLAALAAAIIMGALGTFAQRGLGRPGARWFVMTGAVFLSSTVWAGPFQATTMVAPWLILILSLGTLELMIINLRLAREREPAVGAAVMVIGWLLLGIGCIVDFAAWLGRAELLSGYRTAPLGITGYVTLQFGALTMQYADAFRSSEKLTSVLGRRVQDLQRTKAEIEQLNRDLRRQIAGRSALLSDVVSQTPLVHHQAGATPIPGCLINERYRVVREIGSGGSGKVYEVVRITDERLFALKALLEVDDPLIAAHFVREAQLIATLDHPNIITISDIDIAGEGFVYIVTELASLGSLNSLESPDPPFILRVLRDIAAALTAIHEQGIVHRDIKPSNVLCCEDGESGVIAKLGDFGISQMGDVSGVEDGPDPRPALMEKETERIRQGSDDPQTERELADDTLILRKVPGRHSSLFMGTPAYMAPELLAGRSRATSAADIYAFGILSFELLTGEHPFRGRAGRRESSQDLAAALLEAIPSLDTELAELLVRTVAPERGERPSAAALKSVLDRLFNVETQNDGAPSPIDSR